MNIVKLKNVAIGAGIPKICLPIVGQNLEEILNQTKAFGSYKYDIAEWRADWFEGAADFNQVEHTALCIREILGDTPLLFTFRTKEEGGQKSISSEDYTALNCFVSEHNLADAVDAELFMPEKAINEIVSCAHKNKIKIIISNHDFSSTPDKDEIISRLIRAQDLGADIPKIAVMPNSPKDVITLLSATEEAHRKCAQPLITMSMGALGMVSRTCGEVFGSAVTFGSAGNASAPGQLNANELYKILNALSAKKAN